MTEAHKDLPDGFELDPVSCLIYASMSPKIAPARQRSTR